MAMPVVMEREQTSAIQRGRGCAKDGTISRAAVSRGQHSELSSPEEEAAAAAATLAGEET